MFVSLAMKVGALSPPGHRWKYRTLQKAEQLHTYGPFWPDVLMPLTWSVCSHRHQVDALTHSIGMSESCPIEVHRR
jgi:hypothetical protein